MKQILQFLKDKEFDVHFGWIDKKTYGLISWEHGYIKINLDLFVASTFVHEYLHDKYPNATEAEIKRKEAGFIKRLSVADITALARKIIKEGN